jgi:hypothetical protein
VHIVHDDHGGEVICAGCGLVLESSVVLEAGYVHCMRGSLASYRYNPYNRYTNSYNQWGCLFGSVRGVKKTQHRPLFVDNVAVIVVLLVLTTTGIFVNCVIMAVVCHRCYELVVCTQICWKCNRYCCFKCFLGQNEALCRDCDS